MKNRCTSRPAILLSIFLLTITAGLVPQSSTGSTDKADANWRSLTESMSRMHAEMMQVSSSGDADADFANLMLAHHRAALEMAKAQLLYGKDPQIRRLAQEVVTDQQAEIEIMQLWLKQHAASTQTATGSIVGREQTVGKNK